MDKDLVFRAMMVSMLEQDQIDKLHAREKLRGYLIPNWNVYECFNISSARERYGIPDDSESQIAHNNRIDKELKKLALMDGQVFEDRMDYIHAFDNALLISRGMIIWEFEGKRSIKDMLRGAVSLVPLIFPLAEMLHGLS